MTQPRRASFFGPNAEVYSAQEYDALAARLAEAERLICTVGAWAHPLTREQTERQLHEAINESRLYMRRHKLAWVTPDSAPAAPERICSVCGQPAWAKVNGHWWCADHTEEAADVSLPAGVRMSDEIRGWRDGECDCIDGHRPNCPAAPL